MAKISKLQRYLFVNMVFTPERIALKEVLVGLKSIAELLKFSNYLQNLNSIISFNENSRIPFYAKVRCLR